MRVSFTLAVLTGLVALVASETAYAGSFVEKCYRKTYEQHLVSSKDKLVLGETHAWSSNINDGITDPAVVYTRHPKTVIRTNKYSDEYVLTEGDCRDIIGKPAGSLYDN